MLHGHKITLQGDFNLSGMAFLYALLILGKTLLPTKRKPMIERNTLVPLILFFCLISIHPSMGQNGNDEDSLLDEVATDKEKIEMVISICNDIVETKADSCYQLIQSTKPLPEHIPNQLKRELDFNEAMALRGKGKYQESIKLFEAFIEKNDSENKLRYAFAHYHIASLNMNVGNYEVALEFSNKADSLFQKENNLKMIAMNNNARGGIFRNLGNEDKALELYKEALLTYRNLRDSTGMAECYNNMANAYGQMGKFDESMEYFKLQENLNIQLKDSVGLAYTYENMGALMGIQGKLDETYRLLTKSRKLHQATGNERNIINVELMLGFVMTELGREKEGVDMMKNSLVLAEEAELKDLLPRIYNGLSKSYVQQRDFENAYDAKVKEYKTKNDIKNEKVKSRIAELDAKYQNSVKENEIIVLNAENEKKDIRNFWMRIGLALALALLAVIAFLLVQRQKRNKLLQEKNTIISTALKDKDILLKEIHHRVKNNLQVISSLLNLQSQFIKDHHAAQAINEGRNRVHSMALIHQSLYQKDSLLGIDAKTYFEQLISELFHTYKVDHDRVELKMDIDSMELDVDTMVPLGLMVNELVTNALKYAFIGKDQGILMVSLKEDETVLKLCVADNGIGIENTEQLESGDSFGYQLIEAFVAKMDGELDISSQNGTAVTLTLKDYKKAS